ncbi:PTP-ER [Trypoxylus dichotomus]
MENEIHQAEDVPLRKERNFPLLDLSTSSNQPVLVIQSPKTPTLSRKLKAVSLDSDPPKQTTHLDVSRDVFSMPNTPKRQIKQRITCDFDESNLSNFGSNSSISGSQTLKTLPEVMTLQDFSDNRTEPIRFKAKGLLERRGSNASLTIDLGSNSSIAEVKPVPFVKLNPAKSVNNLNLSSFGNDKCTCLKKCDGQSAILERKSSKEFDRRKSQTHMEKCDNCTIYETEPSKSNLCRNRCQVVNKKCACLSNYKSRRKSLSNENLYVPRCNYCQIDGGKECMGVAKGYRKACYPRQADIDTSQMLSEEFKSHLQNIQYLQTAGNVLTVTDLRSMCEPARVPKLHKEFWEVPLNLQEKCIVSGSQNRNRYKSVLPNEHSRVHLPPPQSYIHANYIKGPDYTETAYIATQGPMAHTCEDFWEMIWTNKCYCIVMLTGLVEKGRSKCELYFPLGKKGPPNEPSYYTVTTTKIHDRFTFDSRSTTHHYEEEETFTFEEVNAVQHGKFQIKYGKEESIDECTIRHLELVRSDEKRTENRTIHHYWFPKWQDHRMANPEQVLKIALHVLELMETKNRAENKFDNNNVKAKIINRLESKSSGSSRHMHNGDIPKNFRQRAADKRKSPEGRPVPIVAHCSAGIGRTGCFLAILNGIQQLRSNFNVDVLAILCSLRLHRGGMVQNAEQYELIHRVLNLYVDLM